MPFAAPWPSLVWHWQTAWPWLHDEELPAVGETCDTRALSGALLTDKETTTCNLTHRWWKDKPSINCSSGALSHGRLPGFRASVQRRWPISHHLVFSWRCATILRPWRFPLDDVLGVKKIRCEILSIRRILWSTWWTMRSPSR